MPFLRDAPSGRSTVSTFEVDDIKVGSEISDLEIVFFLRSGPDGRPDADWDAADEGNPAPAGVFAPDSGGVAFCENGAAIGDGRGEGPTGLYTFADSVTGDGPVEAGASRPLGAV